MVYRTNYAKRSQQELERLREQIRKAGAHQPTKSNEQAASVVRSFKTFISDQKAKHEAQNKYNARILTWNKRTFWAIFVYTLITLGLFKVGLDANTMNAESGRAWVAPQNVILADPLIAGQPVSTRLTYGNLGKEPALNVKNNVFLALVQVPQTGIDHVFDDLEIPDLCTQLSSIASATVSYPSTVQNFSSLANHTEAGKTAYYRRTSTKAPSFEPATDTLGKEYIFVVNACFTYLTIGQPKISKVCMYLEPTDKPVATWEFHFCPKGNSAT